MLKNKTAFTSIRQALKTSEKCKTEELPEACMQALMSVQKPGVSWRGEETQVRKTGLTSLMQLKSNNDLKASHLF